MYLLIFEDGSILQSEKMPVEADESIEAGALEVVRFQGDVFEYREDGNWECIDKPKGDQ